MPLAALIAAQDQVDRGDGLRAVLPLAGRTLIEHQAGLARRAGAAHIVVLVERVPAALAQAIDRLRRDGLRIEIARSVGDAVDRFHPEERVLLVADGVVAAQAAVDALVDTPGPALLALPDVQDHAAFERIDAEDRWAGYAVLDKAMLVETANMLGDWDFISTLLRRLVQGDALRIPALAPDGPASDGGAPLPPPVIATGPGATLAIEHLLLRRAERGEGNWAERHLHRLIAAPLLPQVMVRRIDERHVAWGSAAVAGLAALLAGFGLFWGAVLLLPLATAGGALARRMGLVWGEAPAEFLPGVVRMLSAAAVLGFLARQEAASGGWGWWTIAALVPAALAGMAALKPVARALRAAPTPLWTASGDALLWLAPALTVLGGWRWSIAALAAYAGASFLERFRAVWKSASLCDD